MKLNECNFSTRMEVSDKETERCLDILKEKNHFFEATKSSLEDDKKNAIDYFVTYSENEDAIPIQFKTRRGWPDFPIVIAQPFFGWGNESTVVGRDLKGLLSHTSEYYYIGATSKEGKLTIHRCTSKELHDKSSEILTAWNCCNREKDGYEPRSFYTPEVAKKWIAGITNCKVFRYKNCEIWWKKNWNEKFAKFNLYIPPSELKSVEKLHG